MRTVLRYVLLCVISALALWQLAGCQSSRTASSQAAASHAAASRRDSSAPPAAASAHAGAAISSRPALAVSSRAVAKSSARPGSSRPVKRPASTASSSARPKSQLAGKVICVDPGHGVTDRKASERISPLSQETKPAYVSGTAGAKMTEEQLNLAVGLKLRDLLRSKGAKVVMTRDRHQAAVSNVARAQIANRAGADVCVRLHADGSDNPSARGVSVLVPSGGLLGTPGIEKPSARLGRLMVQAVAKASGIPSRGVVARGDLTAFNWSEVPVVLLEMGFMSNRQDDALLSTADCQARIAAAVAESLERWFVG